jgi:hypothetical protein
MSKKYIGKLCVYCGLEKSTSADHIFARQFFLEAHRADLPKVPACQKCNAVKSDLEHYLTAILPFGARHKSAISSLIEKVPRRLEWNIRLRNELKGGLNEPYQPNELGIYSSEATLPLKGDQLSELCRFIAVGLSWFYFDIQFQDSFEVRVEFLSSRGERKFRKMQSALSQKVVNVDLGNGTFVYEGRQGQNVPEFSVWRIELLGGVEFSDDSVFPTKRGRGILVTMDPRQIS